MPSLKEGKFKSSLWVLIPDDEETDEDSDEEDSDYEEFVVPKKEASKAKA